jgi:hypothetical protein
MRNPDSSGLSGRHHRREAAHLLATMETGRTRTHCGRIGTIHEGYMWSPDCLCWSFRTYVTGQCHFNLPRGGHLR